MKKETYRAISCPRCEEHAFLITQKKWNRIVCSQCGLVHWFKLNKQGKKHHGH